MHGLDSDLDGKWGQVRKMGATEGLQVPKCTYWDQLLYLGPSFSDMTTQARVDWPYEAFKKEMHMLDFDLNGKQGQVRKIGAAEGPKVLKYTYWDQLLYLGPTFSDMVTQARVD